MATLTADPLTRFFADRDTPVWLAACAALRIALFERRLGTGADVEQECDGEVWQYLLTERECDHLVHEFRHRWHPLTMRREYLRVVTPAP